MKSCPNFLLQTTRSTPLDPNLMFLCVSYYLDAFGTVCCVTTLSSKRAKLVQKFVPRCRVGIFRSERTRSTPLDSKLMFWCVSYYLDAFGTVCCVTTLSSKRAKLVQKFVPRCRVGIFHNERTRSTLLDHYLMFRCISYYLGAFGTVCCITTLSSKWAKLVQKIVARRRVGIFRNERTRSTLLVSKLMFWCVSYYLDAFWTVWLPYKTQCKTGRTGA